MSTFRLIFASLWYHRRMGAAVALGMAVAVAVLTGALLVGDSMRGSLRELALDRLGRIDEVLQPGRFFRQSLAEEVNAGDGFGDQFDQAVPAILLRASLATPGGGESANRANRVNVIGCDGRFWRLGTVRLAQSDSVDPAKSRASPAGLDRLLRGRQIVLNRPLADQLGVTVGQDVNVRLTQPDAVPAETPLGRRDRLARLRLRVSAIVEPTGLGAFSLGGSQQAPRNAYVALDTLQERLDRPGEVNALLVSGRRADEVPTIEAEAKLQAGLRPRMSDYGLRVMRSPRGYVTLGTDRLLFSRAAEAAVEKALAADGKNRRVQPALTYLANTIARGKRAIPYSTITAVDPADSPPLGPLLDQAGKPVGPLGPKDIVLNAWAADDLDAKVGDTIRVTYFKPESFHGRLQETTEEFTLVAIVPLAGMAVDRDLLPSVPGVTDQLTMDQWDPPFPFDAKRIRPKDEDYWEKYRGTPKAFVSLAAGRELWASRFGRTTTLRVAGAPAGPGAAGPDARPAALLGAALPAAEMGFAFRPIKRQRLAAAAGTTSFDQLFLGFSFFLILSAVMLAVLLFRLSVATRARQIGLLLAVGWAPRRMARVLAAEGAVLALVGSLLGTLLGLGYAALMLIGLQTWWLAAIVTPFLRLHVTWPSLITGLIIGLGLSLAVIVFSVRRAPRAAPRNLMAGRWTTPKPRRVSKHNIVDSHPRNRPAGPLLLVGAVLLAAAGLAALLARVGQEFQAGAFFGVGAMVLVGLLAAVGWQLAAGNRREAIRAGHGSLIRLAVLGAARHPLRSTLSVGLVAVACFLIVSVSAFRVRPTGQDADRNGPGGHFTLLGESDLPIYGDLGSPESRLRMGFSKEDNRRLADCTIVSFRVRAGDDASCLNLYRPRQPRLLGVPEAMIRRGGFTWAAALNEDHPWQALRPDSGWHVPERSEGRVSQDRVLPDTHAAVPMAVERDTATYSLHLSGGLGADYTIADDLGRPVELEVVGLLKGSPFQGDLLISERQLLRRFPEVSGYQFFLVECPPTRRDEVRRVLERVLGDQGFTATSMDDYRAAYLAVPNTYLSTFQSLGGLGLLLGTLGLAVVQLRNVMERRRELALLRAVGWRRRRLAWLVLAENGLLLFTGLFCGVAAAAVAVAPHFVSHDASIPVGSLAATLGLILLVGLAAGTLAVRAAVATPLLAALREE